MDFTFTSEQDDAASLAAQILGDRVTLERHQALEAGGDRFDADLWASLGEAGLLSLVVPEAHDGAGLDLITLARVVVEAGRVLAPVPLVTHGAATLLLGEAGSAEQRAAWLAGAGTGQRLLTVAVSEERAHLPESPVTRAVAARDGFRVTGSKSLVRAGSHAAAHLVTASTDEGTAVLLVRADAPGVTATTMRTSDGDTVVRLELDSAPAELVGVADGSTATRLGQLVTVLECAELLGVTEGALALTAAYARTREQFGRPIGTFQAVSQRLADGYIDVLGQRLTLWSAAWHLTEHDPAAPIEVATAKLWAADAAHRLAHTTVHVHGGVGIDLEGEAHRFFTTAKRFEFAYGSATEQALAVGRVLANEPA
ncbi:acyl-CoA dehydrogenase family protein [Nocardioides acrostichi]|uniref:Acyl-CoA dehydrogenase family protein n=1 Tax=Nocardioides acrostichi TaxID=2784339 RepID=A0A930V1J9_9ACTN|nr:acyl-CoA dehydrogenase family protein [Nocardioides acrostichi]MBF4162062.1 acyl-CoA dehydrogenase family protein [Nocardioides acrostichi]